MNWLREFSLNASDGPHVQTLIIMAPYIILVPIIIGLYAWTLHHCTRNKSLTDKERNHTINMVLLTGPIGSILYLTKIYGRRNPHNR